MIRDHRTENGPSPVRKIYETAFRKLLFIRPLLPPDATKKRRHVKDVS